MKIFDSDLNKTVDKIVIEYAKGVLSGWWWFQDMGRPLPLIPDYSQPLPLGPMCGPMPPLRKK